MRLLQRTDMGGGFFVEEYEGHSMGMRVIKYVAIQRSTDGRLVGNRDWPAGDRSAAEAKIAEWRAGG